MSVKNSFIAIFAMTATYYLFLSPFIYVVLSPKNVEVEALGEVDPGRNERSTPRSFILPATPAVAFEQERKEGLMEQAETIRSCMLRLYDHGYQPGSLNNITGVHVLIATLEFQEDSGLSESGELDLETRKALEC